jgi:hypothetical protein
MLHSKVLDLLDASPTHGGLSRVGTYGAGQFVGLIPHTCRTCWDCYIRSRFICWTPLYKSSQQQTTSLNCGHQSCSAWQDLSSIDLYIAQICNLDNKNYKSIKIYDGYIHHVLATTTTSSMLMAIPTEPVVSRINEIRHIDDARVTQQKKEVSITIL